MLSITQCGIPALWQTYLSNPASIIMERILFFNKHLLFLFFIIFILLILFFYIFYLTNSNNNETEILIWNRGDNNPNIPNPNRGAVYKTAAAWYLLKKQFGH